MAFLTAAFAFLVANWAALLGLLGALLGIGAGIARFTPNPKDDQVFAKLLGWLRLVPVPADTPTGTPVEDPGVEPPIMG